MKPWHHVVLYPGDGTWMVVMGPWDVIQRWKTWDCYNWLRRQLWSFKSLWLESCENQADIWRQMSWNICSRTGIGVERCIWYVIIFGWHFYRFNVFRNQESHFQHSRRLLERPILSSSCKVADEHPVVAGEREVDHLFETTIKSPKGLWEVKCLAAAQNRSALAAIP